MLKLRRERDWVPGNVAGYTIAASRANTSTTPSTTSSGPARPVEDTEYQSRPGPLRAACRPTYAHPPL
jgi:hypothetical protein